MSAHRLWMKSGASGRAVNFNHSPVDNHENHDIERGHGKAHKDGLEPEPEQGAELHRLQLCLHIGQHIRGNFGAPLYQSRRLLDNGLRHIKHAHHDIEGVDRMRMAQKVLNIHLKNIHVSMSCRLFRSMSS